MASQPPHPDAIPKRVIAKEGEPPLVCPFCSHETRRFMYERGFLGCVFCYQIDQARRTSQAAEAEYRYFRGGQRPDSRKREPKIVAHRKASWEQRTKHARNSAVRNLDLLTKVQVIAKRRDEHALERLMLVAARDQRIHNLVVALENHELLLKVEPDGEHKRSNERLAEAKQQVAEAEANLDALDKRRRP